MSATNTASNIIKNWINKGDSERDDDFNKFICYWIALNCFYSSQYNQNNEREAIESMKWDSKLKERYRENFLDNHHEEKTALIGVCPIVNVKRKREYSISPEFPLCEVIEVLYRIRCNLFHGDKSDESSRDVKVIKAANPILTIIVKICSDIYSN